MAGKYAWLWIPVKRYLRNCKIPYTSAAAADAAVRYHRPDYSGRVVLVLGSEGRGLRPRVAETCDELVALPNRGKVGSLNVATAASALVYGILHFRGETLDRAP